MGLFAYRVLAEYRVHHETLLLLVFAGEAIMVMCVLAARFSDDVDRSPLMTAVTVAATFYFAVVKVTPGLRLVPQLAGITLQCIGIALQIAAKLWLGRSFGLRPANRGIVTSGPYRLVRHPIYLGYFLNHVGFMLLSFSVWNLTVYAVLYTLQVGRILAEERLLTRDEQYRSYVQRVRYRLVPGIF